MMNEKFFSLPKERQEAMINAGFRVFSQNSYRKSPMSEIAEAADVSKSLLFHYFRNKKELYLFLWETGVGITLDELEKSGCYEQEDLFETMHKGIEAKFRIMRKYPDLAAFVVKAFYEKDPAVCGEIQESIEKRGSFNANASMLKLDPDQFIPGLDLEMMYWDMYWASEGYIWEKLQRGKMDLEDMDQIEAEFMRLIDFWKSVYLRKDE